MKEGAFREDLYFRLAVVTIPMPRLRDREGDVLLLGKAFLNRYAEENKKEIKGFTNQAIRTIEGYSWPGNVRELENRIKRAVIMAAGSKISPSDLELAIYHTKEEFSNLKEAREAVEEEMIRRALARHKDNVARVRKISASAVLRYMS